VHLTGIRPALTRFILEPVQLSQDIHRNAYLVVFEALEAGRVMEEDIGVQYEGLHPRAHVGAIAAVDHPLFAGSPPSIVRSDPALVLLPVGVFLFKTQHQFGRRSGFVEHGRFGRVRVAFRFGRLRMSSARPWGKKKTAQGDRRCVLGRSGSCG